jgi:hypothetical protein
MKPDGRLARNHLNGAVGDAIPAPLSGAWPQLVPDPAPRRHAFLAPCAAIASTMSRALARFL